MKELMLAVAAILAGAKDTLLLAVARGKRGYGLAWADLAGGRFLVNEVAGDDALEAIAFADGGVLPVRGLFVAQGVAGSADLAKKVGAETVGNRIAVGEDMQSSVPLLFAAGDCTGGMMQIAKAVYEGARAGTEAVRALRARKKGRA